MQGPLTGLRVSASTDMTGDGAPDVVISAPDLDGSGAVYVFSAAVTGEQGPGAATGTIKADTSGSIGEGLSACGDMNGDGVGDLVIGLPDGNGGRGGVWVLNGPFTGSVDTDSGFLSRGLLDGGLTGYTVDCRGDLDGDSRADLIYSAPMADGFGLAEVTGQVYLHRAVDGGTEAIGNFSTTWNDAQLGFERSLTLHGDLDGDGLDDAVLGSHGVSKVYTLFAPFQGTLDGNLTGTTYNGREDDDSFGYSTAVGDINGDGYPDVAAGAPWFGPQYGAVGILEGPLADLSGEDGDVTRWVDGQDPKEFTGFAIDIANLDGDGMGDLILGAPGATTAGPEAGVVYGVLGPADISGVILAQHVIVGNTPFARLGHSVAAVPDANGDGLDEVLLGAPYTDVGDRVGAGAALLFHSPLADRVDETGASATFIF